MATGASAWTPEKQLVPEVSNSTANKHFKITLWNKLGGDKQVLTPEKKSTAVLLGWLCHEYCCTTRLVVCHEYCYTYQADSMQ